MLQRVGWFEVVRRAAHVEDGKRGALPVAFKVGFLLRDDDWLGGHRRQGIRARRSHPSQSRRRCRRVQRRSRHRPIRRRYGEGRRSVLALYDSVSHHAFVRQAGFHPQLISRSVLGNVLFCLGYPDQALAQSSVAIVEARRLAQGDRARSALRAGPPAAARPPSGALPGNASGNGANRCWVPLQHTPLFGRRSLPDCSRCLPVPPKRTPCITTGCRRQSKSY
jgi:hypothetical protein